MNIFLEKDINEICNLLTDTLQELEGKSILISGVGGFLGRYFLKIISHYNSISNNKIAITGVDNFISSDLLDDEIHSDENIKLIQGDICEKKLLEDIGFHDYIVHAAGIASPFYYRAKPLETLNVAVDGSRNLLDLAQQMSARYIFFSSSEIYGDPHPDFVPIQESYRGNVATQGPRACYDESKRLGETLSYIYHHEHGTHTNIIRPFNIYGPGMQERDYRVMPNFASRIKGDYPLRIYGPGTQTRTFCYIVDAMVGFLKVIVYGKPAEPYNIGNPTPEVTISDLADVFQKASGKKISKVVVDYPDSYPADEPMRRCPDIRKAKLQLSYKPEISLEVGVSRFLSWSENCYVGEQ
jgi:UDP-glucuronate decarboxylase